LPVVVRKGIRRSARGATGEGGPLAPAGAADPSSGPARIPIDGTPADVVTRVEGLRRYWRALVASAGLAGEGAEGWR